MTTSNTLLTRCSSAALGHHAIDKPAQPHRPFVHPRYAPPFNRHAAAQADKGEFQMTDNVQKNQGQNPGQSGQQSGQQQQKNPQDVSKKDPSQDRNKEQDDRQGQKDQGGQRRAS
jgi:hypothetical protein